MWKSRFVFFSITANKSGLRVPLKFIATTRISRSSRSRLRLHRHVYRSRLARSHPSQDRHGHRFCSMDTQPVDGGPWAGDRGRGRRTMLDDCCRGPGGFSRNIPRGFLSTCRYRQTEKHSPLREVSEQKEEIRWRWWMDADKKMKMSRRSCVVTQECRLLLHYSDRAVFVGEEKLLQLCHFVPQKGYFILMATQSKRIFPAGPIMSYYEGEQCGSAIKLLAQPRKHSR